MIMFELVTGWTSQRCPQAAANVSVVRGSLTEQRAKAMSARGRPVEAGTPYSAAALSLVFHPASPLVPTLRADVRLFQVSTAPSPPGAALQHTPAAR
jgi:coproporphyrinogen III oxidase